MPRFRGTVGCPCCPLLTAALGVGAIAGRASLTTVLQAGAVLRCCAALSPLRLLVHLSAQVPPFMAAWRPARVWTLYVPVQSVGLRPGAQLAGSRGHLRSSPHHPAACLCFAPANLELLYLKTLSRT